MGKICYFSFVRIMFFVIFPVLATVLKLWFCIVVTLSTPIPSSGICIICEGIDELRSLKFKDAINEFADKIETFKHLTKSFN